MSKLTKILIGCLVIVILVIILYQWGFSPLYAKIIKTNQQIKVKQNELKLIKAKVESLPGLEQALSDAGLDPRKLSAKRLTEDKPAEICRQIDLLARLNQLKVNSLVAAPDFQPYDKNQQFKYLSVQMEGTGYFQQLANFFNSLAGGNLLLQVEKYSLTGINKSDKALLKYRITINAFEMSSKISSEI